MAWLFAILAAASVAGLGCGGGSDSGGGDQSAITAVLTELRQVQDSGDAKAACSNVYVLQEPDRPGGEPEGSSGGGGEAGSGGGGGEETEPGSGGCEASFLAAVDRAREEVSDLQTSIGSIDVEGDRATAIVHTELKRQDGSALTQDVPYDLVRTPEGWRVRIADEG